MEEKKEKFDAMDMAQANYVALVVLIYSLEDSQKKKTLALLKTAALQLKANPQRYYSQEGTFPKEFLELQSQQVAKILERLATATNQ